MASQVVTQRLFGGVILTNDYYFTTFLNNYIQRQFFRGGNMLYVNDETGENLAVYSGNVPFPRNTICF